MEEDQIEKFFRQLEEINVGDSKNLSFFLTAERKYFDSKKARDNAVVKDLFNKLISGKSKIDMSSIPVSSESKCQAISDAEEKRLSTFMDELTEYVHATKETHKK